MKPHPTHAPASCVPPNTPISYLSSFKGVFTVAVQAGREALKELEFYAHLDLFTNPTAAMADVVLPVASAFEREGLKIGFDISPEAQSRVQLRPPVVPPPGEARPDTDIIFALAQRLGFGTEFWDGDIDASYRHQLAPIGIGLEELRASPGGVRLPLETRYAKHAEPDPNGTPKGFATPSRKVELYSQTFLVDVNLTTPTRQHRPRYRPLG